MKKLSKKKISAIAVSILEEAFDSYEDAFNEHIVDVTGLDPISGTDEENEYFEEMTNEILAIIDKKIHKKV